MKFIQFLFLIDPSSLTIFNELIQSAPESEKIKLRVILEDMLAKEVEISDTLKLKEIFKKEFLDIENLGIKILKKFDSTIYQSKLQTKTVENSEKNHLENIEYNYQAAKDYMNIAFRIQLKRSIESMWKYSDEESQQILHF